MSQIVSMNKDDALTALSKGEISIEQFSELFTIKEKKPPRKRGRQPIKKEKAYDVLYLYIRTYCPFHKLQKKFKLKDFSKNFIEHNTNLGSGQIGRRRIEEYLEICNSFERREWGEIISNLLELESNDSNRIFIRKEIGDFYSFFNWASSEGFKELQYSTCKCEENAVLCTLHPFSKNSLFDYFFDLLFKRMWICYHFDENNPIREYLLKDAAILIRESIKAWYRMKKINELECKIAEKS
ncbi:hypothetical protein [Thiothrix unzii]|uniref:Uncharacterized protein n=2 Tax=Thiothrix fructosivorans TaxID=111770 RepID=A0A8B0SET5_9GAMM|nr:hypothetical protein [Thiothrix unzii]MBO0611791.1 hypothetical protein [Thiothrix fructosivorans]MDX9988637.1 hypothetical protein [Thiothrix unzii]QTX10553.1 hypothetical protein J1836_018610 [Thiothrix fructosivorans]